MWVPIVFFVSIGISALLGFLFERGEYDYDSIYKICLLDPESSKYSSGDSITDVILNYYSGLSDFPDEMKAEIYKNNLISDFTESSWIKDLKDKDPKQTLDYLKGSGINLDSYFTSFPDSIDYNYYYQFVWNTYFRCGSPKIRFSSKVPFPFSETKASAYYNPFSKVLFLNNLVPLYSNEIDEEEYFFWSPRDFLEELSHAKQFKEKPFTSYFSATWGLLRSFYNSSVTRLNPFLPDSSWAESYQDEYHKYGSFENEAHSIIFPHIYEIGCAVGEGL